MNIVMSWSKVKILLGKTGANQAMATTLASPGTINDKSTSLSAEDGDKLEAKATGGIVIATEEGEPTLKITTRIKEMDFATEAGLIDGVTTDGKLKVKSNVISDDYSIKVIPKNVGAIGIMARRGRLSFRPGYSEEEGHYVDLTYTILACDDGELYTKFRVAAADLAESAGDGES